MIGTTIKSKPIIMNTVYEIDPAKCQLIVVIDVELVSKGNCFDKRKSLRAKCKVIRSLNNADMSPFNETRHKIVEHIKIILYIPDIHNPISQNSNQTVDYS